jgi:hypothetical protein
MTGKGQREKWAAGFLAVVCALLILNLVMRGGARAGSTRRAASAASSGGHDRTSAPRSIDELARYDPGIHLDQLKELEGRPLPKIARNPFAFVVHEAPKQEQATASAPAPATPAPPPPPPIKAVGYSEQAGGLREAIVMAEDQIFVVHEGETFAKRYHVVSISPSQVEISDENTHQNVRLPVPQ